jgi:hypothetical protein
MFFRDIFKKTEKSVKRLVQFRTDPVDPYQIRCRSICLEQILGMLKLQGPEAFRLESLGDLSGIPDEVVSGERKLEAKLPLLRVQPPAKH